MVPGEVALQEKPSARASNSPATDLASLSRNRPRDPKRCAKRPELRSSRGLRTAALAEAPLAVALRAIRIWLSVAPSCLG
jgi:hypothetical protein